MNSSKYNRTSNFRRCSSSASIDRLRLPSGATPSGVSPNWTAAKNILVIEIGTSQTHTCAVDFFGYTELSIPTLTAHLVLSLRVCPCFQKQSNTGGVVFSGCSKKGGRIILTSKGDIIRKKQNMRESFMISKKKKYEGTIECNTPTHSRSLSPHIIVTHGKQSN